MYIFALVGYRNASNQNYNLKDPETLSAAFGQPRLKKVVDNHVLKW
jgi:hypothetical protein